MLSKNRHNTIIHQYFTVCTRYSLLRIWWRTIHSAELNRCELCEINVIVLWQQSLNLSNSQRKKARFDGHFNGCCLRFLNKSSFDGAFFSVWWQKNRQFIYWSGFYWEIMHIWFVMNMTTVPPQPIVFAVKNNKFVLFAVIIFQNRFSLRQFIYCQATFCLFALDLFMEMVGSRNSMLTVVVQGEWTRLVCRINKLHRQSHHSSTQSLHGLAPFHIRCYMIWWLKRCTPPNQHHRRFRRFLWKWSDGMCVKGVKLKKKQ